MTQRQNMTAFIYDKRGRVLSVGQNSYVKTHPLQAKYASQVGEEHKVFLHAEISAITKCRDLSRAHRILIIRYDRHGNPALAKPCNVCQSAIDATEIKIVEHT
jgi:hypothetical protein